MSKYLRDREVPRDYRTGLTQDHRIFVPKKIAASVRGLFGAAV